MVTIRVGHLLDYGGRAVTMVYTAKVHTYDGLFNKH